LTKNADVSQHIVIAADEWLTASIRWMWRIPRARCNRISHSD
jgi:hypothetical protein